MKKLKEKLEKARGLVDILAIIFAIGFADGFFNLGLSGGLYAFMGFLYLVVIGWLLVIVHKK